VKDKLKNIGLAAFGLVFPLCVIFEHPFLFVFIWIIGALLPTAAIVAVTVHFFKKDEMFRPSWKFILFMVLISILLIAWSVYSFEMVEWGWKWMENW